MSGVIGWLRAVILFCVLFVISSCYAGSYFVIDKSLIMYEGFGGVCDALVKVLDESDELELRVCRDDLILSSRDVKKPVWRRVSNLESGEIVERFLSDERKKGWGDIDITKNQLLNGTQSLWVSSFDFNYDGKSNVVYKLQKEGDVENCSAGLVDFTAGNILPQFRYFVESNNPAGKSGFLNVNGDILGGVVLYKGRPFFYKWGGGPYLDTDASNDYGNERARIVVFETGSPFAKYREDFAQRPVCEIGKKL